MANWTRTTVTLVADNDALLSFLNKGFTLKGFRLNALSDLNGNIPKLTLSDFIPEPEQNHKSEAVSLEEWKPIMEWRYANWGTKWDAEIISLSLVALGERVSAVEMYLKTANGFVEPMLRKLKDSYPEKFKSILCLVDEDMFNYYGYFDIVTDKDGSYIDCADDHEDLFQMGADTIDEYVGPAYEVVTKTYGEYRKKVLAMVV